VTTTFVLLDEHDKAASELLKNQHVTFYWIRFCKKDCALSAIVVFLLLISRALHLSVCLICTKHDQARLLICLRAALSSSSADEECERKRSACYFAHALLFII
jgi:hypothetical protein